MNPDKDAHIDAWIEARKQDEIPAASPAFTDSILERLDESPPSITRPRIPLLLKIAAVVTAGLVGYLRMEIVSHLILLNG